MTFETFDQPDFWKIFRFLRDFQIFGRVLDFWKIFGRFLDFWKIFIFLEDFQIFERFSDFCKIFRYLEDFQIFGGFSGFLENPRTFDIWDTDYNSDNREPEFMTIFVSWQLLWHWTAFAILAMFKQWCHIGVLKSTANQNFLIAHQLLQICKIRPSSILWLSSPIFPRSFVTVVRPHW